METIIDYDDYFEKYMGKVYYHIMSANNLNNMKTIVEFAPGFRWKIAYALKSINFDGTIFIIDSNKNVTEFVEKKYSEILPNSKIIVINKDLIDSIELLPKDIDLFVSNHCIDDMIISKYLVGKNLEDAFNNTAKSKEILIKCWNELREVDNLLFNIKENVYNDLSHFFENINFKFIIMSQYKSGYYMNEKNYVEDLSKTIFDKLKAKIDMDIDNLKDALSFEFEDFDVALNEGFSLKENIQFYDNWIAGKFKGVL